jgi:hypothetical protein
VVTEKIKEQAAQHSGLERLLTIHGKSVPEFASILRIEPSES